jgi:cysteine desulfurase
MPKIYLDNAASTPLLPEVLDIMCTVLKEEYGNPSSIHAHGRTSRTKIEEARKIIAKCLHVSIGEIFFTSCATEANNLIIKKAVESKNIKTIITSTMEHPCVANPIVEMQNRYGTNVVYIPNDTSGNIDYDKLATEVAANTNVLVSIMHVNNEIGNINDINLISKICEENAALFHTDAVQGLGKIPLDLSKIKVSYLSASAHKFHGPKGAGFFYMNSDCIIEPLILGGAQERNMRAGTENIAGIYAMAKAFEIALNEREEKQTAILKIRNHFKKRLQNELEDIRFNGNQDQAVAHILNVSFPDTEKADLLMFNLDINGISASSGSACSSGIPKDSMVMESIQHPKQRKAIRFSFSHNTTIEEIDFTVETLKKLTPVKK